RLDQGLGRLLQVLEETGRYDDSLIIYLSDNGIAFPGAKTTLYEPGMRLPLVVRSPDQKRRGIATSAMVTWADIAPTILDFAGALPADHTLQGRSFRSVLEEESPAGWDEIHASHTFHEVTMYYPMRVIRGRRYKYILNLAHGLPYPFASDLWESATWQATLRRGDTHYGKRTVEAYLERPRHELYDLEEDPHEVRNLADDPARAEILEELQAKLKRWQEATQDPWVYKYRYE
ncbi:MAG: sulfatase-like hydrolase/transferase, partial [Planctomycetes bacterium]|nr:sulfatase-like hydrolase/transferase [Planctomycetota bacterium]